MIPESTTPLEFFRAIGYQKLLQVIEAAKTDSAIGLLLLKAAAAERIRRDDPELRQGLNDLAAKGLLTNSELVSLIGPAK